MRIEGSRREVPDETWGEYSVEVVLLAATLILVGATLFDLSVDPDEMQTLLGDPAYEAVEQHLRAAMEDYQAR